MADDLHGLAAIRNADEQGQPLFDSFAGQAVDENSILVKFTINGDADLNGKLDASDYFLIDKGFLSKNSANPLTGYRNGDFDYNDKIDASRLLPDRQGVSGHACGDALLRRRLRHRSQQPRVRESR